MFIPFVKKFQPNYPIMKKLYFLAMMFCTGGLFAQHAQMQRVIHLNNTLQKTDEKNSVFQLRLKSAGDGQLEGVLYDAAENVKAKGTYIELDGKILEDGYFTYYYYNGQVESEGAYSQGIKVGLWKRFDMNGVEKAPKNYPMNNPAYVQRIMKQNSDNSGY